jgi:hypothetical protein
VACVEDGRTLRDAVQVVNEVPVHVWHLFLHEVKHEVAHIAERVRPGSRVAIVAKLESEHKAPLPLGFVLAMLGLVGVGELVADEPILVHALADLLFCRLDRLERAGRLSPRQRHVASGAAYSSDRFGWRLGRNHDVQRWRQVRGCANPRRSPGPVAKSARRFRQRWPGL